MTPVIQLYEQGTDAVRIGLYRQHWVRWVTAGMREWGGAIDAVVGGMRAYDAGAGMPVELAGGTWSFAAPAKSIVEPSKSGVR